MREEAFDPGVNMMATFHGDGDGFLVAVKGAPESVLRSSSRVVTEDGVRPLEDGDVETWLERNDSLAEEGLRVLAVARKTVEDAEADPYVDLEFLGLVGLLDPPRREIRDSIGACRDAGIRVVMVTGDHPLTARNVASAVGLPEGEVVLGEEIGAPEELSAGERRRLLDAPVLARVTPEQKMDLLALHQGEGSTVAMIGDGVNDAPALKRADIGVAMGQRGTQVAQEASDMVLRDDRFDTIVSAVRQGRAIFDNIRKFVVYLLSCNVSEILVVALAVLASAPPAHPASPDTLPQPRHRRISRPGAGGGGRCTGNHEPSAEGAGGAGADPGPLVHDFGPRGGHHRLGPCGPRPLAAPGDGDRQGHLGLLPGPGLRAAPPRVQHAGEELSRVLERGDGQPVGLDGRGALRGHTAGRGCTSPCSRTS